MDDTEDDFLRGSEQELGLVWISLSQSGTIDISTARLFSGCLAKTFEWKSYAEEKA